MKKLLLSALLGGAFCISSAQANDVVVHAKPPHAVGEHPSAPPNPGNIWIGGYRRWDGGKYGLAAGTLGNAPSCPGMQSGWLPGGSAAMAGMFSWKAGGSSALDHAAFGSSRVSKP